MTKQKNEIIKQNGDKKQQKINTSSFCQKKIDNFQRMITDTLLITKYYKSTDLITTSDYNTCIRIIEEIFQKLTTMKNKLTKNLLGNDLDNIITELQEINNELSSIFRTNGTKNITDVINVAMGHEFSNNLDNSDDTHIYDAIKTYLHPISYIVFPWKGNDQNKSGKQIIAKNKIVEDFMIVEKSSNFDCFDLARTSREFQKKVYGIKVAIHNKKERKTMIISCIYDDILTECVSNTFINNKLVEVYNNRPDDPNFKGETFLRFIKILTIKELLIYNKDELYQRFIGYINQIDLIKQKPISQNIREFVGSELYEQRKTLMQLLLKNNDPEFQYLAYLLYDLLSNDSNGTIDTTEQSVLFDSMPWNIKKYFKDAMKITIDYTQSLSNFENSKIFILPGV